MTEPILQLERYLVKTKAYPPQHNQTPLPFGLFLLNFYKHEMVFLFILFFQSYKFISSFAIEYLVDRHYSDKVEDPSYNFAKLT